MYRAALLLLFVFLCLNSFAQDLEQTIKSKPLQVNGGINFTNVFYEKVGAPNRRQPHFWLLNVNLNLKIFGNDAPFSATFSNQQSEFSQPFNQIGISPKYKWITAHLGWRSLNLSTYTLSGNQFLGVGVEMDIPDSPLHITALHGRFVKGIDPSVVPPSAYGTVAALPSLGAAYERWGSATKIRYTKKFGTFDFILFRGTDSKNSITVPDSMLTDLPPAENLVVGFNAAVPIDKKSTVYMEFARSFYTRNKLLEEQTRQNFTFADNLGPLFLSNTSTAINNALIVKANRNFKYFQLNAEYRKVDPEYESMGSPFLNNDIENYTGGLSFGMWKRKIMVSANGGIQRDNIDNSKQDRTQRLIMNGNVSFYPTQRLNFNLNVANFTTNSFKTAIVTNDSLQFFQITRNYTLSSFYQLSKSKSVPQSVFITLSKQGTSDIEDNTTDIISANVGYTLGMNNIGLTSNVSFNYFRNDLNPFLTNGYGPTVQVMKKMFKGKVNTNFLVSNAQSETDGVKSSDVYVFKVGMVIPLFKGSALAINGSMIEQVPVNPQVTGFKEYTATITYSYVF